MDGRVARGDRTRTALLDSALRLATTDGLDGLSLAQLAHLLGVSKSALYAHWDSKEQLQLATIEHAQQQWRDEVVRPALASPRGVRRLWAVHDSRIGFYERGVLPGGCFFAKAQFEYSDRAGAVHDALATTSAEWIAFLERLAAEAVALGELVADTDPHALAFEVDALGMAAVMHGHLHDPSIFATARAVVLGRLRSLSANAMVLPEA